MLAPLLFLIYVNDFPHGISSICKTFADNAKDSSLSFSDLSFDLDTINKLAHQCKMSFDPDPNKQATEVLFSRKINSDDHPKLSFNGNQVQQCSSQKHLGLFLDNKFDFNKHVDEEIDKCNKMIGMMQKLSIGFKNLL